MGLREGVLLRAVDRLAAETDVPDALCELLPELHDASEKYLGGVIGDILWELDLIQEDLSDGGLDIDPIIVRHKYFGMEPADTALFSTVSSGQQSVLLLGFDCLTFHLSLFEL